jgi:branched-chain amino acid transport system substrate-binding protein
VTGNWAPAPNLFAAGGSVQYYPAGAPSVAFVSRQTHSPSIAFLAYGIAASADACQGEQNALQNAGYHISYSDLKVSYPGTTVATDVQRMRQAGTNMIVSCMDVQGNVTMARAVKQYGLKATQLWFNGNDAQTLSQNKSLMQGIYFNISHVPFTAPLSQYPGLKLYETQMKKYAPKYEFDEVAIQGWESAALFVQGVKMAGNNLTQQAVIDADNSLTSFTAGDLIAPINWKDAGHTGHAPPYCSAFIKVVGNQYVPTLNQGKNVIVCFQSLNPNKGPVYPLPAGTPTPQS